MTLSKMFFAKPWSWLCYVFIVAVSGSRSLTCFFLTVFWMFCGVIGANHFGKMWGIGGYVFGFLVGFLISSFLTWLIELGIAFLFRPLPVCRQGKCRGVGDYAWQMGYMDYRCNCGDKYIFKVKEKKFMQLLPDGTQRPYKKLVGFHKWADDTE